MDIGRRAQGKKKLQKGAKNRNRREAKLGEREIAQASINNGGGLWEETRPPKLEVSIDTEFVMSTVYSNATFGVFTNTFFEEVREIEVVQGNGLVTP
jgi:hypothetical protein